MARKVALRMLMLSISATSARPTPITAPSLARNAVAMIFWPTVRPARWVKGTPMRVVFTAVRIRGEIATLLTAPAPPVSAAPNEFMRASSIENLSRWPAAISAA